MRTPNTKCIICGKPLYRRPSVMENTRFSCCKDCRSEAYKKYPSEKSLENLELGREKGTNHLEGISKSEEQKENMSNAIEKWCEENPKVVEERGKKMRGDNHYNWKGGITKLNQSIRRMTENRKWMDKVKERDGQCAKCGSIEKLEAHHLKPISEIIEKNNIENREDARECEELWDIENGMTLCAKCHCEKHNRKYSPNGQGRRNK